MCLEIFLCAWYSMRSGNIKNINHPMADKLHVFYEEHLYKELEAHNFQKIKEL